MRGVHEAGTRGGEGREGMVMLLCCSALALVPFTRATDPLPASVTLDDDLRSGLALSLALSLSLLCSSSAAAVADTGRRTSPPLLTAPTVARRPSLANRSFRSPPPPPPPVAEPYFRSRNCSLALPLTGCVGGCERGNAAAAGERHANPPTPSLTPCLRLLPASPVGASERARDPESPLPSALAPDALACSSPSLPVCLSVFLPTQQPAPASGLRSLNFPSHSSLSPSLRCSL